MWQQRAERAERQRDGALCIAALALSFLTDDQKQKLRDHLVCLRFEEEGP